MIAILKTVISIAFLTLFCLLLLTATESGTRWLLPRLILMTSWPVKLQYQSGTIWTGLHLRQLQLTSPKWVLRIDQLFADGQLDWTLRGPQITIKQLTAQQMNLQLLTSNDALPTEPFRLPRLSFPITVHLQHASVAQLILQNGEKVYPRAALQFTGNWQEALALRAHLQTPAFDLAMWNPKLSAKLEAEFDLEILVQRKSQSNNELHWHLRLLPSQISGTWYQKPVSASVSAEWQTQQSSQVGIKVLLADNQWEVNGSIAAVDHVLDAQAWLSKPLKLNWQLHAAQLSHLWSSLGASSLTFSTLEGQLHASGQLSGSLRDPIIQAQIRSEKLQSGRWELKNLQSELNLKARLPWPLHRENWQINILPSTLAAQWRDQPLTMNIEASIDAQQASQIFLKTQLADNRISIMLQNPLLLSWQVNAPHLAQIWPDLHGQIFSQGNISGSMRDPLINAILEAKDDRYQYQKLSPSKLPTSKLPTLKVSIQGKLSQHDLQISAADSRGQMQLKAQGGINLDVPSGRYHLQSSNFSVPALGKWQQQRPSEWSQHAGIMQINRTCWTNKTARLCAALQGKLSALSANMQLSALPLAQLHAWVLQTSALKNYVPALFSDQNVVLQGLVNANLQSQLQNKQWQSKTDINVSSGALLYSPKFNSPNLDLLAIASSQKQEFQKQEFQKSKRYSWRSMHLQIQSDTQALKINGAWDYQQYGHIQGQLLRRSDGQLSGQLLGRYQQLSLLEPYLVGVQNLQGQVLLNLQVVGHESSPVYTGNLEWKNGSFRIPAQNLLIRDIVAHTKLLSNGQLALTAKAYSDKGLIELKGHWLAPTRWTNDFYSMLSGQLRVQGDHFQVSNTQRSKVWIAPDLSLTMSPQKMVLSGVVQLSPVSLRLKELPHQVVTASKDVVLMKSGRLIHQIQSDWLDRSSWLHNFSSDIKLILGQSCHFQGVGLQADLTGQLQLLSVPGKPPQAYGEISIPKGNYQKYGQDLTIQQGLLHFQGAPDNPALNIQAVRRTNFADVTLALSGTLKTPSSKVHSSPPLPESEAMALLVTGKPLSSTSTSTSTEDNNRISNAVFSLGINRSQSLVTKVGKKVGIDTLKVETGNSMNDSALLIGKYLNPTLYLTYIRGLFSQNNSVGMEYKLTPKATIKAQSGNESSLDVLYQFERD